MSNDPQMPPAPTRPDPVFTPDAIFFWEGAARGELLGQRCADCKKITHPPRPMCPACHSVRRETVQLSGRGKVASFVIPRHPAPIGFPEAPIVALIELEEGIRLVSNLVDVAADAVRGGLSVEVRFAPTRGGKAVPVFAPAKGGAVGKFAAIAGIGQTEFSKNSGRSELQLAAEASKAALDDAGIDPSEVDGMITFTIDNSDEIGLSRCLGVKDLAYATRIPGGGAASVATIYQAAQAVISGACEVVVVWRAMNERSQYRFGQPMAPAAGGLVNVAGNGTGSLLWCMPFGAQTPASWAALSAGHYMERYGVTNRDLGHVSVAQRKHAATNPLAWFYGKPITLEDHQASKWIVEPVLRLLDCCQESDGGVAIVITSLERARDAKAKPVRIVSSAQSIPAEVEVISNYYHADLDVMPEAVGVARRLYRRSGLTPADMQLAMIYDAFTPQVLVQLEGFGFCKPGEAKDFVKGGNIEVGGSLPVNTNGGLIGEAYIHGMNNITEAVRQLRGTATNQVANMTNALVSCGMAGAILSNS